MHVFAPALLYLGEKNHSKTEFSSSQYIPTPEIQTTTINNWVYRGSQDVVKVEVRACCMVQPTTSELCLILHILPKCTKEVSAVQPLSALPPAPLFLSQNLQLFSPLCRVPSLRPIDWSPTFILKATPVYLSLFLFS